MCSECHRACWLVATLILISVLQDVRGAETGLRLGDRGGQPDTNQPYDGHQDEAPSEEAPNADANPDPPTHESAGPGNGGEVWVDRSAIDDGYHPEGLSYGKQTTYGNGTGRPDGGWSNTIEPSQIAAPSTQDIGVHHLTLTWQMPKENGAIIDGYRVESKEGTGKWQLAYHAASETELATILNGLRANTEYEFRVIPLFNGGNRANSSQAVTVRTEKGKPGRPTKPYVTDMHLQSMMLHWLEPSDDGGDPISGYRISIKEDDTTSGGAAFFEKIANTGNNNTSALITELKAGAHIYEFRVNAINAKGTGLHSVSSLSYATLHTQAPEAPPNITAAPIDDKTIRLQWQPADSPGEKVTGYRVEMQTEGKGPFKVLTKNTGVDDDGHKVPNALLFDATDLDGGREYKFSIQGVNRHGSGKKGFTEMVKPTPGVPHKLKEPPSVGQVSDKDCLLEWDEPWDGGLPIVGYRVWMRTANAGGFVIKIDNTTSSEPKVRATGLTHGGVMYEFKVAAINALGVGPSSEKSSAVRTLYSASTATADAVMQAMEDFKAHNKIHRLWELEMENERYNKQSATQQKIVKNAEEMSAKSRELASQIRMRLEIETDLSNQKLIMEKTLGEKNVGLEKDLWHDKRKLLVKKYGDLIKEVKDKSQLEIDDARNIARKKIETIQITAEKACDSKLKDEKTINSAAVSALEAQAASVQKKLLDDLAAERKRAEQTQKRIRDDAKRQLDTTTEELNDKFRRESNQLKKQLSDLIEKMPKELPAAKKQEEKQRQASQESMKSLAAIFEHPGGADDATRKAALNEASKLAVDMRRKAQAAEAESAKRKQDYEEVKLKQSKAEESVRTAEAALKQAVGAELGSVRWNGVINIELGEGSEVQPIDEDTRKRLMQVLEEAKIHLKSVTKEVDTAKMSYEIAQAKASQLRADAEAITSQVALKEREMASNTTQIEELKKNNETAAVIASELEKSKNQSEAIKKEEEKKAAEGFQQVTQDRPIWGHPCPDGQAPTAEEFQNLLPDKISDFKRTLKNRKKTALQALCGSANDTAQFLTSCEMMANCKALGGIVNGSASDIYKHNCHKESMCSAGSPKADARPCKTCATVFAINRWRQLNRINMPTCDGGEPCAALPLTFGMCTMDDVQRNPEQCKPEGVGRDPAPSDLFNPKQDVSLAHTHCTSCYDGDALEILNPDTGTGICRRFGPDSGAVNLASMPTCYNPNNLEVRQDAKTQVCTKIHRPALLYAGNNNQSWLINRNMYAYVTCDVRKMVNCAPDDSEKFEIKAEPAAYSADCGTPPQMQQFKCQSESQVSCRNVCLLSIEGDLCLKDSTNCNSNRSWTPDQARTMMRRENSSLLGTVHDLTKYDCDPVRCEASMCHQLALVS